MGINRKHKIAAAIVAGFTFAGLLWAHSSGPDPRHTGAPGDDPLACTSVGCHVGTPLNGGGGNVQVQHGESYTPGVKQTFTIVITDSAARVYGFQMTARLASNLANGVAGTFTPDSHQIVICDNNNTRPAKGCANNGVEFIEHSLPYTVKIIVVTWTPPSSDVGDAHIYVAVNAANGNTTEAGDHIYTTNFKLSFLACSGGKPAIAANGILNGASFSNSIQSGSWATIFGTDLAINTRIWNPADEIVNKKLPLTLDTSTVTVGGKPAAVFFITPTQINFQVPDGIGTGPVSVVVGTCGGTSSTATAQSLKESPGFFMFDPQGRKYIAALIAKNDGTVDYLGPTDLFGSALATRPVLPGEIVLLFGTGFGPTTDPNVVSGQTYSGASPTVDPVRVTVGGVDAQVLFAGISGAGLYQINLVVPNVTAGDQKVVATINSLPSQDGAFITVGSK